MANDIKVTIKADNKQFLDAIAACSKKLAEFSKSAGNMKIKDAKLKVIADTSGIKSAARSAEETLNAVKDHKITLTVDNASIKEISESLKTVDTSLKLSLDNSNALAAVKEVEDRIKGLPAGKIPTSTPTPSTDMPEADSFTGKLAKMGAIAAGTYATLKMMVGAIQSTIAPVYGYSSAMEQNTVAFKTFLGSTELATKYLGDLQKIAADTPFELPGVTEAGKKLLAFGFDAEQSLQMLRTIGDTAAGLGQGTEGIDRITLALGQIKAKGKVMGDELLQLTEAGIPAYTILADKLGLTSKQVKNIGDAGIDADTAISALLDGMNEKFGGLSQKISDTKQGMMSTIRDNALAMGEFLYRPFDDTLKSMIRRVRDWTNDVADAIRKGDTSGAFAAMFPTDIVPKEWLPQIKEIKSSVSDLFEEGRALASQFGDDGKQALVGIVDAALDVADGFISVSRAVVQLGNDLLYIVRSILPDGVSEFVTMREMIELAVKSLVGFFVLQKIIKLVQTLRKEYLALKLAMVATSTESAGFFAALSANILKAIKNLRTMKDVVGLLAKAFKLLSRSNIPMMLLSIGLSLVGDKLIDLIEKYFGKNEKDAKKIDTSITDATADARDRDFQDSLGANEYKKAPKKDVDTVDYAAQKKAMERQTKYLEAYYASQINKAQSEKDQLDKSYSSSGNIEAQTKAIKEKEYQIAELQLAKAQQIKEAIEGTAFEEADDKRNKLLEAQNNIDKFERALEEATQGLQGIVKGAEEFGVAAVQGAESRLGTPYGDEPGKLVCTQLVVESWKDAKLPFAQEASEWVPTLIQQAKDKGLWREPNSGYTPKKGDAIVVNGDNHVGLADGKGGIYHASSSRNRVVHDPSVSAAFGVPTGYIAASETMQTDAEKVASNLRKYQKDFEVIRKEGEKVIKELAEATGDVSTYSKQQLNEEYGKLVKKFKSNGLDDYAESAEKLLNLKVGQADLAQIKKDLETAYDDAQRAQKAGMENVAKGAVSALDVANEVARSYTADIQEQREEMRRLLKLAQDNDWKDIANSIKDALDSINKNIKSYYDIALAELDEELRRKLALIASDSSTTTLQKEDLSDEARREYYEKALAAKKAEREELLSQEKVSSKDIARNDFEIAELQNQLDGLGSALDKVHEASKQAFEDGLLDFLSRGINQCESLGDAFRSLASTILQEIQRVYAEALTKNIMGMLFPTVGAGARPTIGGKVVQGPLKPDGTFAEGGAVAEDQIHGPGTGVSDSILAWVDNARKFIRVSDGEWIMKQKAVNYYGPNLMRAINRGMIPRSILESHARFAEGGSLRGAVMTTSGKAGAHGLTADIANNFSPTTKVDVRIDGNEMIKGLAKNINTYVDNRMWEKSKEYSMIAGLHNRRP